jgi:hypothetical protein
MQAFKFLFYLFLLAPFSCSKLDRNADIVSETGLLSSKAEQRLSKAKSDILLTKQNLKLAIIKLNLMTKRELRDGKGNRKAVFIEAKAFSPILLEENVSPFHLFKGDPIFTKLVPEFYQLLDALEYRKVPVVVDCLGVPDCRELSKKLGKQYRIKIYSLSQIKKGSRSVSYIVMLSSTNDMKGRRFSRRFRTAFKHKWLSIPLLYKQGLAIEEWANLIPKVKEF